MKVYLSILLFCSFSLWAIDSKVISIAPDAPSPWIMRAYYDSQQQLQKLSEITPLWQINRKQKFTQIKIKDLQMYAQVKSLGLELRIDKKLQNKYFTNNVKLKPNYIAQGGNTINGYSCYSTVEGTFDRMQDLVNIAPTLAEIIDIGDSWEKTIDESNGYDLQVLKITNQDTSGDKPIVFITSAIHAREYTTAELTTRFAEYLVAQYDTNSDVRWMLDHQEIHLLLHTNPDGRKKAEAGILWRKNTNQSYCSPTSSNRGADLNRNYPFLWQADNNECGGTFPGATAKSEPELISVMNHIENIFEDNRGNLQTDPADEDTPGVFLDIHSSGQLVLWPWGFTSTANPNASQYQAFGRRVAYYNHYTPEPISDFTIALGSSVDTSYGELGVASLAFELGTEFFEDCDLFESTVLPDNLDALLYITRVTRTPYITPLGPDIENLSLIPNYILPNQIINLSGTANEDRYNHSHGNQSFDQVQQIDVYINDLPWLKQNVQTLPALDGSFDSSVEKFDASINTNQLSIGEHTVYAVAKDTNNISGGVYSKFVNVVDENLIGTVSGRVTDAITGAVIDGAQLQINESLNVSDSSGQYSILSPPVVGTLSISANGYAIKNYDNIEIIQQQITNQNVQLEPYCSIFFDDVEKGNNNWTVESPWAIVTNQSASPIHSWTDSPNGEYANNTDKSITSSDISITHAESFEVSFNHLCNTEAGYDYGHVEVKFDNSNWQNVLSCDGQDVWESVNKSMPIPVNSQQMQLRFRLTSDGFVTEDGWYLDDINVRVSGQACRDVFDDLIFENDFEN